jgi:hypothetical protein
MHNPTTTTTLVQKADEFTLTVEWRGSTIELAAVLEYFERFADKLRHPISALNMDRYEEHVNA